MSKPAVIIGCGKSKHSRPLPAQHLYRSTYIRYAVAWSKSVGITPYILSAKYGIVPGTQTIRPYTASFKPHLTGFAKEDSGVEMEPPISVEAVSSQISRINLTGKVILFAGSDYRKILEQAAPDLEIISPFLKMAQDRGDGRQGYQVKLMRENWGRIPDGV